MQLRGYRFVNHTADIEFVARGGSPDELFTNALLALFDTISYLSTVAKRSKAGAAVHAFEIREKADSLEELAWLALQDALSKADANGLSPFKVSKIEMGEKGGVYGISSKVEGIDQDPKCRRFDVKGVSRYRLKISKRKDMYSMSVVLDV